MVLRLCCNQVPADHAAERQGLTFSVLSAGCLNNQERCAECWRDRHTERPMAIGVKERHVDILLRYVHL